MRKGEMLMKTELVLTKSDKQLILSALKCRAERVLKTVLDSTDTEIKMLLLPLVYENVELFEKINDNAKGNGETHVLATASYMSLPPAVYAGYIDWKNKKGVNQDAGTC